MIQDDSTLGWLIQLISNALTAAFSPYASATSICEVQPDGVSIF